MNYQEYFQLTASSPQDLRNVVADYLYDLGKDVESEAMRSGLFEKPIYVYLIEAKLFLEIMPSGDSAAVVGFGLVHGVGYGSATGSGSNRTSSVEEIYNSLYDPHDGDGRGCGSWNGWSG